MQLVVCQVLYLELRRDAPHVLTGIVRSFMLHQNTFIRLISTFQTALQLP